MKRAMLIFAMTGSLAAVSTSAQTPAPQTPAPKAATQNKAHSDGKAPAATAQAFVAEAAKGGLAEVELGQLASTKATNPDVKAFAQRMVTDHSKANDELKALASQKNITLPTSIGAKEKAEYDKLSAMSGAAFDQAYVRAMLADHRKDVAEFTHQSTMSQDADVKAWAAKTLPTLKEHLSQVESLSTKTVGTSGHASQNHPKTSSGTTSQTPATTPR